MSGPVESNPIRLRGVRHNNLKGFDLDVPMGRLVVITGLSGSGKSSLAFDTLYAEGQRRYIETFSPYARQFFDRMDKPQVDSIENIPPAIAIEQRNAVRSTRSTVGTMTEICDHMKVLWPHLAQLHCRKCGQSVRREPPQTVWQAANSECRMQNAEVLITFDLPLSPKLSIDESLSLIAKQGYQRILVDAQPMRIDEVKTQSAIVNPQSAITVIQDRLRLTPSNRARFVEACEQAYHFGKGKLTVHTPNDSAQRSTLNAQRSFSSGLHCAACDLDYREPSPALFSFNHPVGACPKCKGFGRTITIDYHLAIPDRRKTLREGVVKPWQSGMSAECQRDMLKFCRARNVPADVPFQDLSREHQDWIIQGEPDYGIDEEHEWPRAWYGVKGYFRWLESKAYKMHVRVLLSRYRAYTPCPDCHGARLNPEALLFTIADCGLRIGSDKRATPTIPSRLTLADFYALPVNESLGLIEQLRTPAAPARQHSALRTPRSALDHAMDEVRSRLRYLNDIGLGYLTLDRPTRTLSGGETERVNLAACLGTRLVNTLFVLDEPSVGLHPRDTERLVRILEALRDEGNTVVVVEHERSVMEAADQIIDLGPGHGATGGELVFQGTFRRILKSARSLTGRHLSGKARIDIPQRRPVETPKLENRHPKERRRPKTESLTMALRDSAFGLPSDFGTRTSEFPWLHLAGVTRHNLQDLSVEIPLNRFVCISGVSGSGKSTLIRDVLLPALESQLQSASANPQSTVKKASDRLDADDTSEANEDSILHLPSSILSGCEHLDQVVLVDQSTLGKTPRSNPAVYIGAFDDIRELFAQTDDAKQRGLNASAFSFNSAQGQCERCRGAGFEKVEMQFLSDIFIRCPDCNGRRYREHILEVRARSAERGTDSNSALRIPPSALEWSIADLLEATVDEAMAFLEEFPESRPAARAANALGLLQDVGLGYLQLGQPINTLSGGESQRLKLVRHLADAVTRMSNAEARNPKERPSQKPEERNRGVRRTLEFGLHSAFDIRDSDFKRTLFLLDEPTTGLHFDDVRVLLDALQRLVDAGHSLVVIEHNLDVLKCADWIIDLGPEAGAAGGRLVVAGTPEDVASCKASHTGRFLRKTLKEAGG